VWYRWADVHERVLATDRVVLHTTTDSCRLARILRCVVDYSVIISTLAIEKAAPFDRPYATFYLSAIVTFSSFLTLNNIVTLKSGLNVTQGH